MTEAAEPDISQATARNLSDGERCTMVIDHANAIKQLVLNAHGEVWSQVHSGRVIRKLRAIRLLAQGYRPRKNPPDGPISDERRRFKLEVLTILGGARCACCGETDTEELTIDHITPCRGKRPKDIYKRVQAEGYPRDRYQVLCRFCNVRKGDGAACDCRQGEPERAA